MFDYWRECVHEAFEDAGISATEEQIDIVIGWVEGGHENYGMAMGHDVASANLRAAQRREVDEVKALLRYEQEVERKRCNTCSGHGTLRDGWGREFGCPDCAGRGHKATYQFKMEEWIK